jgi:hypothetical protein
MFMVLHQRKGNLVLITVIIQRRHHPLRLDIRVARHAFNVIYPVYPLLKATAL